ncbi:DUF996 domain-containing protein [Hydrogenivirga sp.]
MSRQTKQLGSWGLVIALVGSVVSAVMPLAGIVVLAGWIMTVFAYFKASDELGEPNIKGNVVKALIAGILAGLIFVVGGGAMMANMYASMKEGGGMGFGGTGFLIMVLAWVAAIVASWFWYKANDYMAEKTSVKLFKTGGLLMFVGALLTVIMIGGLISLVGEIILIVAWFSVQEQAEETQPA